MHAAASLFFLRPLFAPALIIVAHAGYCINGTVYKTLEGSTPAECCAACASSECVGWGMQAGLDSGGAGDCQLMKSPLKYHRAAPGDPCIASYKEHHQ